MGGGHVADDPSRILKCQQPCSNASLTMPTAPIDIHPHIIANDAARYPLAPLGGHQSDWSRTRPVTLEQLIAAMDEAGVQKAAIVQASTCYGHDNSYVADAVAAHPDRCTGVFSVDVLESDAPQRMRDWRARASPACGFSRSAAQCPSRLTGWIIRGHMRPGLVPASWAFPSACKCRRGNSTGGPHGRAISECAYHSRSLRAPELADGPPYNAAASLFGLASYPNVYLKLTPPDLASSPAAVRPLPRHFFHAGLCSALPGWHGGQTTRPAKVRCPSFLRPRGNR